VWTTTGAQRQDGTIEKIFLLQRGQMFFCSLLGNRQRPTSLIGKSVMMHQEITVYAFERASRFYTCMM
jgi:hypothetical protein